MTPTAPYTCGHCHAAGAEQHDAGCPGLLGVTLADVVREAMPTLEGCRLVVVVEQADGTAVPAPVVRTTVFHSGARSVVILRVKESGE